MKCRPKGTAALFFSECFIVIRKSQKWTLKINSTSGAYNVSYHNVTIRMEKHDFDKYFEVVDE